MIIIVITTRSGENNSSLVGEAFASFSYTFLLFAPSLSTTVSVRKAWKKWIDTVRKKEDERSIFFIQQKIYKIWCFYCSPHNITDEPKKKSRCQDFHRPLYHPIPSPASLWSSAYSILVAGQVNQSQNYVSRNVISSALARHVFHFFFLLFVLIHRRFFDVVVVLLLIREKLALDLWSKIRAEIQSRWSCGSRLSDLLVFAEWNSEG